MEDRFLRFVREVPKMLRRVRRWSHFSQMPESDRETVETHSLSSVWVVGAMLAIERVRGSLRLDGERLLLAASLHDVGEGHLGDVRFAVKNDPRVRRQLVEIEHEHAAEQFRDLPDPVRRVFESAYALENEDSLDGRFFNASERLGYVYCAFPQVARGRGQFLEVFLFQHEPLLKHSKEFVSVAELYAPFRPYVEEWLRELSRRTALGGAKE